MKTTDLFDKYEDQLTQADVSSFKLFGRRATFGGEIVTVSCFEDNTKAKKLLEEPSNGRILVIDGGASYRRALMGDNVAAIAVNNGWQGVIINGYIRDSVDIDALDLGVIALGATARRPLKNDDGECGVDVAFANVTFRNGAFAYADADGLLLSPVALAL